MARPIDGVRNLLTDQELQRITHEVHRQLNLDLEAVETIRAVYGEFAERLSRIPNRERDVDQFIQSTLGPSTTSELTRHTMNLYRQKPLLSTILDYLLSEVIELAGNRAIEQKRNEIAQADIIIAIINDEDTYHAFKNYMPPFAYTSPSHNLFADIPRADYLSRGEIDNLARSRGLTLSKELLDVFFHIGQYLALYYHDSSPDELYYLTGRIAEARGAKPEEMHNPIHNLVKEVLISILYYAQSLSLEYNMPISYRILIHASLINPYLSEVPMVEMFAKYSPEPQQD